MEYQTLVLKNGIRLVHMHINSPVAHLGLVINTGSREELANEQGMAHFIEHVIFKGTKKRKAYHVVSRLEDVGGELNAYTTKEETAVYGSFLSEYYQRGIELLSDIFKNSTFPERELKKEKEVIIEEINSYEDSPSELIFDDFEDLVFEGHSLGRNILGKPDEIRNYGRENIFSFLDRAYNTDEIVLSSIGNVSFKLLSRWFEKYFSDIKPNSRSFSRVPYAQYESRNATEEKDTYQAHCILGNLAYGLKDSKRIKLVLLNNILGGSSMSSRLNLALREKNGLAYNVESNYTIYSDTGVFNVYFGTEERNLDRALSLVEKEFAKLRNTSLGTLQMSKAKKQLQAQLIMSQVSHEELMLVNGKGFLFFNTLSSMDTLCKQIDEMTASDLMEVANEVLDTSKMSKLIYL